MYDKDCIWCIKSGALCKCILICRVTYIHVKFCVISEYSVCVLCFLQTKEAMSNNGTRYLREPWEATGSRVTSIPLAPKDSFKIHTVICSTFLPQNGRLFLEPHSNTVCT